MTCQQYLQRENTVAIANIDTRKLTRILRTKGAQNGCILACPPARKSRPPLIDESRGQGARRTQHGRPGPGQGRVGHPVLRLGPDRVAARRGYGHLQRTPKYHVVAFDYGVKKNILRMLAERGCKVTVVPAQDARRRSAQAQTRRRVPVQRPRRPGALRLRDRRTRELIEDGYPTFGICLGHQIMALASGAKTFKMKFGHHGANHPVKDLDNGRVSITSQNHGFAVDEKTLPANLRPTHVSLFDGTLQGLARTDKPAFCFQGHPEASPGPHDIGYLFDRFTGLMDRREK
jgi:carbamoyl-phosphate synthase small subunit